MNRRDTINIILDKIKPVLVHLTGLEDVLQGLGPFFNRIDGEIIRRQMLERGYYGAWQALIEILKTSGTDAFDAFRTIIATSHHFIDIRDYFESLCKSCLVLSPDISQDGRFALPRTYGDEYEADARVSMLIENFKSIIISRNSTEEDKQNLKKLCTQQLEKSYKFKFVMIKAIVDDLCANKNTTKATINNAKTAICNLLPYAVNLCRCPTRQEYSLVKKYTAHFQCKIKNNLQCSPDMPDNILASMGYRQTQFQDEVRVDKVSKYIVDIALDLYMCSLELERILNLVCHATANLNFSVNDVLSAIQKTSRGNTDSWYAIDVIKCIQGIFRSSRTSLPSHYIDDKNERGRVPVFQEPSYEDKMTMSSREKPRVQRLNSWNESNVRTRISTAEASPAHPVVDGEDWMYGHESAEEKFVAGLTNKSGKKRADRAIDERLFHAELPRQHQIDRDNRIGSNVSTASHSDVIFKPPSDDLSISNDVTSSVTASSTLQTENLSSRRNIGSSSAEARHQSLNQDDLLEKMIRVAREELYENYKIRAQGRPTEMSAGEKVNVKELKVPSMYAEYSLSYPNVSTSQENLSRLKSKRIPDIYQTY